MTYQTLINAVRRGRNFTEAPEYFIQPNGESSLGEFSFPWIGLIGEAGGLAGTCTAQLPAQANIH
jgi:hypothetical protein